MKTCPRCNREYGDPATNFCLDDGELLVSRQSDNQSRPVTYPGDTRRTQSFDLPPTHAASPPAIWQPASFAAYRAPSSTLATASLVLGIVSMTVGWCCLANVLTAPAAIICGGIAVSRINADASRFSGRSSAVAGIILGGVSILLLAVLFSLSR